MRAAPTAADGSSVAPSSGGSAPAGTAPLIGADPGQEPQALLEALAAGVARALPTGLASSVLTVDRRRSLGDRLAGRPGTVEQLRLAGVDEALTLRAEGAGARLVGELARVSGGVVIARRTLPLGAWLETFAGEVAALAVLGVRPAGADLVVPESDLPGGLRTFVAAAAARLPAEAAAVVERTAALIVDTLPRVVGRGESEVVVQRTATVYLPDTVRAYLALPPDWADRHRLADGTTAREALLTQLAALASAAERLRDAAVAEDAAALLTNGRFLDERFRPSRLELP